jgi:hypothetical protein
VCPGRLLLLFLLGGLLRCLCLLCFLGHVALCVPTFVFNARRTSTCMTAEYTINAKSILRALKKVNDHHGVATCERRLSSLAIRRSDTRRQFAASFKIIPADADIELRLQCRRSCIGVREMRARGMRPSPGACRDLPSSPIGKMLVDVAATTDAARTCVAPRAPEFERLRAPGQDDDGVFGVTWKPSDHRQVGRPGDAGTVLSPHLASEILARRLACRLRGGFS